MGTIKTVVKKLGKPVEKNVTVTPKAEMKKEKIERIGYTWKRGDDIAIGMYMEKSREVAEKAKVGAEKVVKVKVTIEEMED